MSVIARFKEFIEQERLFEAQDILLLAVSGGIDSVVLCALCAEAGYDFVIAHGNFQLRGTESDRDEAFVRRLGGQYGKEVLVKAFDTAAYAAQQKVSIQVAARELRYEWFASIVNRESSIVNRQSSIVDRGSEIQAGRVPSVIVTAHHLDDNIETVLMKFFKGTGVAGLRGILPRQGQVARPLLWARKELLQQYAVERGLSWVEDSSNAEDKYARNYLRHQVVPLLEKLYPDVVNNLSDNIGRFREVEVLYRQAVEAQTRKLLEYKGSEVHIPVLKLKQASPLPSLVFEITRHYGFTTAQTSDILRLLEGGSGRYVASGSHRIIRNRQWLIIAPLQGAEAQHILIEAADAAVEFAGGQLQFSPLPEEKVAELRIAGKELQAVRAAQQVEKGKKRQGEASKPVGPDNIAYIDTRHLQYPLILRRWKAGDYFYPLGMPKKKKLARFLIDQKVSLTDKEKVWVLESRQRILWVVGMRIDDRFKIVDSTRAVCQVTFIPG